ncbi:hypothetical protein P280DRAFT_403648 [Massarina eburnea CBS 473.64]|uniref:Uncharacterized protein n=1 Tax=Massarina eburnea CBS 473.64 TaxID=1395130 RepID=A0A6A6RU21_9PLEO|nr:hypothetical protein P280DRAFT_403648 [Massarina eburnea CBS 473.64]
MPNSPSPPPLPSTFSFTAGGFDYPEATTSSSSGPRTRASGSSRVEGLTRFLGQRQRERERRAAAEREDDDAPRVPLITRARRREMLREARRVPPHAERGLSTDFSVPRSLLNLNPFAVSSTSRRERSPTSDADEPRRQSKRRKLAHDDRLAPEYDGFKYGYKGQVVAGRLQMSIISCDGGEHDKHNSERLYRAQNVLHNDKSVYCSENSECNLLLKHRGEAPFCLEKIVIRAPDRGFTAPVQEGLIFVAMSADDLEKNTAAYKIDYASRSPTTSPSPSPSDDQLISLREAIEDPDVLEQSRQGMEEQIERLRLRTRQLQTELTPLLDEDRNRRRRTNVNVTESDEALPDNCPYHIEDEEPSAAGVSAPTPPPFTITTEDDQEDSEDNATMSPAVMADRLRRERRWRPESDEEEGNESSARVPLLRRARALDSLENFNERRWRSHRLSIDPIRATRLRAPSRIEPTEEEIDAKGLIEPHARFFIARNKNKITIKFHPAISGKYVLLKLWSPTHDGNIDIESVQFHGYSGPRFFPAVQLR